MDGAPVADELLGEAARRAGTDEFGDDWFLGPLRAWAVDLEQPGLTDFGQRFLRSLAVRDLVRRLEVLRTLRANPEIDEVVIPPIVYVTGLERSGTTLLHNLLALHRDARVLRRWELMEPVPPPCADTYATDERIAAVQDRVDQLRGTALEGMHWVNADDPEECVWGFVDSVSMLGQAAALCMPAWRRFLVEEDLTPAFVNYRRVVRLLLWKHPVAPGGFLVLKAPQISNHLGRFADAFPEARFVITDRDPYRCLVSTVAMGASIVAPFCVDNPLTDDGTRSRIGLANLPHRLAQIAALTTDDPARVLHLGYPELVNDHAGATKRVSVAFATADDQLHDRVDAFVERQRSGGRAAPPAELPTMGYDPADVWTDPVMRAYCERFGIEPEHHRLTGQAAEARP